MHRLLWYAALAGVLYVLYRTAPALQDAGRDATIAVLVAAWAVLYVLACVLWPFASCRHCKGGRHTAPSTAGRGTWRNCRACGGGGKRIRWGRRMWDRARAT